MAIDGYADLRKPTLHEMVTSQGFTTGEWRELERVRQMLPVEAYTTREWMEREWSCSAGHGYLPG